MLSVQQQFFLFYQKLNPRDTSYNIFFAAKIHSSIDITKLRIAYQQVIHRHSILRTIYPSSDGSFSPVVLDKDSANFEVTNAVDQSDAFILLEMEREYSRPFNLEADLPIRLHLFQSSEKEFSLLIIIHHIAFDFVSYAMLVEELFRNYQQIMQTDLLDESDRVDSYDEFIDWQKKFMSSEQGRQCLHFWQKTLEGVTPPIRLPEARSLPSRSDFEGAKHPFFVDSSTRDQIRKLAKEQNTSLYSVIMASWHAFLFRHSPQNDVVVGMPVAGRSAKNFENKIGCFINTLPVRSQIDPDMPFDEFLSQVSATMRECARHQDFPLALIVEELGYSGSLENSPFFNTVVVLQRSFQLPKASEFALGVEGSKAVLGGVEFESIGLPFQAVGPFDISLMLTETSENIQAALYYNRNLFDAATIAQIAQSYLALLRGICSNAAATLSSLPIMDDHQERQVREEFGHAENEFPSKELEKIFSAQVEATPNKCAVMTTKNSAGLTYRELDERSNQFAHFLQKSGIRSGEIVAISLERSVDILTTLLATLKVGATALPIDTELPVMRRQFMIRDSGAKILVTDGELISKEDFQCATVELGKSQFEILAGEKTLLQKTIDPNTPAYVLYTSGSTGQPKGVAISRRALANFLEAMQKILRLKHDERLLATTTISFDIAFLELLLPISVGGTIVLATREEAANPTLLTRLISDSDISVLQATPATWQMLIDAGWRGKKGIRALCGGEALSPSLANAVLERVDELWNLYGPTETTIWVTAKQIAASTSPVTVGRPIANTTCYILDPHLQPTPIGIPGELHIGGVGLAIGYLNRPELTAEKFIPSPFPNSLSDRLYKTGDLARWLPNGEIEILGRIDHQVKIRGYRIELGEIEEQLKQCAGVKNAVVIAREDTPGNKRLVAYVIGDAKRDDLKNHLGKSLPEYMVPSAFVFMQEFPLNNSGKLDRKALPAPDDTSFFDAHEFVAPRGPIEQQIADIWAEALGVERVSVTANFFEVGGHSLLAVQLVSRMSSKFNVSVPLRALFEQPTIAALAHVVEELLRQGETISYPKLERIDRSKPIPLSYSQRRLWFLDQLESQSAFYNVPILVKLDGPLNLQLLRRSLLTVLQRHEALRTVFVDDDGEPTQVILGYARVPLEVIDLRAESDPHSRARELAYVEAQKPFNLAKGPLFLAKLLRLGDREHHLLITLHHIVSDGWSINLLMRELVELYGAAATGRTSMLPELRLHYADFTVWQRQCLEGPLKERQLAWWQQELKGAPPFLNLPLDYPRPQIQTYVGKTHEFKLDRVLVDQIKRFAEDKQTTPFIVLLSAFAVLLHRYCAQDDIMIGTPVAGRMHGDVEHLIGCFINTLALRADLRNQPTFSEAVERIKNFTFGAFAHQDLPFEELVDHLKLERDLSHSPLFQVMFNYLSGISEEYQFADVKARLSTVDRGMAHFDLSLTVQEVEHELFAQFEYNTDLFSSDTIERMASHFVNVVHGVMANPEQPIHAVALLTDWETKHQLYDWNQPQLLYPQLPFLHRLFEERVAWTPNDIALVFGELKYTFAELNSRANVLAHDLVAQGIKPETIVGICVERSADFMIAMLGVMKAGAAYVPIDPEIPEDRLRYILNDTKTPLVITQSHLISMLILFDVEFIYVDQVSAKGEQSLAPPEVVASPDDLAYVIYTSGSTGEPKGVEITHASIADRVQWKAAMYSLDPHRDVVLHAYSFIFDGSIINYLWPLCFGIKLVIASSKERRDAREMIRLINQHQVTTLDLLPSLLHAMLDDDDISTCKSLRYVFSGGEALSGDVLRLFYEKLDAWLHNTYGPTEATVEASVWVGESDFDGAIAPIGRPIAGAKLYVLDRHLQPLPIGVAGELHIGGIGVARRYLNKPELTAQKFIDDPFGQTPGAKLYKTGDLVKYRSDSVIEFIGRFDNQIKVRGFRIELAEIEGALTQVDEVREALVMAHEDASGQKYIVAYVIPAVSYSVEADLIHLLREQCSERLPAYMVPRAFVLLPEFPTLLNGKIDLQALPESDFFAQKTEAIVTPRNDVESKLLAIWIELLKIEGVCISDNFFDVGGHSLLAVRLMSRIRSEFGIDLPLASLFQHPTIEALAHVILSREKAATWSPLVPIQTRGKKRAMFFIHPVGGNVLCYQALSDALGKTRPFYGLQARGLEAIQSPHTSIPDMAKEYIDAIRKVRPKGPYVLGGWSFGGLVAVEMAHQLELSGQKVERVILIDSIAQLDTIRNIDPDDNTLLLETLSQELGVKSHVGDVTDLRQVADFFESGGSGSTDYSREYVDRLLSLVKANYLALQKYSVPNIDAPVILIKAEATAKRHADFGWAAYASRVNEYSVAGDHWSILRKPKVLKLARLVAQRPTR